LDGKEEVKEAKAFSGYGPLIKHLYPAEKKKKQETKTLIPGILESEKGEFSIQFFPHSAEPGYGFIGFLIVDADRYKLFRSIEDGT